MKNLRFTTVLSVRHVRSDERVARRRKKFAFYHSFERSTRTKSREGCQGQPKNSRFTTVLSVRHVRSDKSSARSKICILPQFWASDTSEVTKGLPRHVRNLRFTTVLSVPTRTKWRKGRSGQVMNLHFTTVLSVRHVRSDERVDGLSWKFAFYYSFERPTGTKWRGVVKIHRCDPCAPDRKRIYFNTFSCDFD